MFGKEVGSYVAGSLMLWNYYFVLVKIANVVYFEGYMVGFGCYGR